MSAHSHAGHSHGVEALADDPTRTVTTRQRYARGVRGALAGVRSALREGIVELDAFGLQTEALADPPRDFNFSSDAEKERAFDEWLDEQLNDDVLQAYGENNQWIERAYERGVRDGNTDLRSTNTASPDEVAVAIDLPEHRDKLETVFSRNFRQLEGLTADIGSDMSRILADGMAAGDGPRDLASDLADVIGRVDDGTPRGAMSRATMIARTEVLNAHHQGQITQWERFGVERVEPILAPGACEQCQAIASQAPYTRQEAASILPAHPNCRCSWTIYTN